MIFVMWNSTESFVHFMSILSRILVILVRSRLQFLEVAAPGLDLSTPDLLMGSFSQYTGLHLHVRNYPDFAGI